MSKLSTYTFLPWLRQGIANQITGTQGSRATIPVDITIEGEGVGDNPTQTGVVSKEIQIYGPGDVIGIDPKSIVKVEPRNWITNFEPNYLPYIEFYNEGFPWQYSPMPKPSGSDGAKHRLTPWLALIVLKEDEFEDGKNIKDKPLPFIKLKDTAKLQDATQLWAWAHVHVNESLIDNIIDEDGEEQEQFISEDTSAIASKLDNLLNKNPDLAYSRIVCPRKLEEKSAYYAFLVPTFETGRQAGLGQSPDGVAFDQPAWDEGKVASGSHDMPYYHRWYFRTGTVGDFEYLVRLLEPKVVDSRVGIRDMDVQDPGANLRGLRDAADAAENEKLHGILKLGGALKIPRDSYTADELDEVEKYEEWATQNSSYPHPFQSNIASFVNLSDNYEAKNAGNANKDSGIIEPETNPLPPEVEIGEGAVYDIENNPDPLITAPLYGRWHALTQRLLKERDNSSDVDPNDNWVHDLNLDPRWRVAAGFGTKVVQENQENYMEAAWKQVGDVLEANKKIKQAQLARAASRVWYKTHLKPLKNKRPGKWLNLSAPVQSRVLSQGVTIINQEIRNEVTTVRYQTQKSRITAAATSVNLRKILRPKGKFAKRLTFDENIHLDNLVTRINEGKVSAAPPKEAPKGIQTPDALVEMAKPFGLPDVILDLLGKYAWLKWIPLILALIIIIILFFLLPVLEVIAGLIAVAGGLIYLFWLMNQWTNQIENANNILEENQTPESIDALPQSPDFRLTMPGENFVPTTGNTDSTQARLFKNALKENIQLIQQTSQLAAVVERPPLDILKINEAVFQAIEPNKAIGDWIFSSVLLPPFIQFQMRETFTEAMAYPKFDLPMYKPLADYSSELFLPNINFISQNSISILETNQQFIEAYMVGLNHEFARELLWREYPTDQRGSYFRQFWDASGFMDIQPVDRVKITARYAAILAPSGQNRIVPDLQEYYDKLKSAQPLSEDFLIEARALILKEELKDIKPIHYWPKKSDLGDNDNRELEGDNEEELVLLIRGELLKKYPTAVVYAHRAEWQTKEDENGNIVIDNTKERRPIELTAEDDAEFPPTTIIKSPLYEAKVDPDIYFFGFDLTVPEAKGGSGENPNDDPGWFFVIKERPGEPRFGLDIGGQENMESNKLELWNDFGWDALVPSVAENEYIQITADTPVIKATQGLEFPQDDEKKTQHEEDAGIIWKRDMNAAELAYILYQVPVLVAVHASEMLPK